MGEVEDRRQEGKEDRKQIGLPGNSSTLLDEIVRETPWFGQALDCYRLAIGVALARELKPSGHDSDSYETKYSTSSIDPDRTLRELVLALAPECGDRPYDWAQRLANKGIHFLHSELVQRGRSLTEVLGAESREQGTDG